MAVKIALDAGHGLKTAGKQTPDGIKEWTLNDKVRDKVIAILNNYDVEIINTDYNEGGTDESLGSRLRMYLNASVKAFVSIHHNAFTGTWNNATGVEVYTDANPTAEDNRLAACIYKRLVNNTGLQGRGIKAVDWYVINQDRIPAVLCEGGFMDGSSDYKYITSDAGQTAYAKAVAEGLIEFLGLKKKSSNNTAASSASSNTSNNAAASSNNSNSAQLLVKVSGVDHGDVLNVRKEPNANAAITGRLAYNDPYTYTIVETKNGWGRLKSGLGWINLHYTKTVSGGAVAYMHGGINYALVFDPTYYASKYADLKKAFGTNASKLFNHFINHGMKEGRQAIVSFNVIAYKNRYADLQKAFGNNMPAYYKHYIQHGYNEKRNGV